ncbi:nuclear transport factor 2 family protein [Pseudoclavibacter sp. AY1F1]|uniref:nuclear transport factor 2 family protein n=1 Tax=Pseudoclavibacter sp. AY1F1 TaxID=2080583 RepID=UPI000CE8C4B4|nr:DUF4440 domain-containing protein [Pseudoclavibacter sp. AY1F1]PPF43364.1 nuclear transport factor 2 family protein [Pseudoclavibacter sp. AY1F1]
MWETDTEDFADIKNAELALLSSSVRGDSAQTSTLLAEDFAEIGRSGRRWTYAESVAALESEEERPLPRTSEWLFNRVSAELVLVNYVIHEADRDSRHASLWDTRGPKLRYHQGTVIPS